MIGTIAGDIIGSRFEFHNISEEDFDLFASNSIYTDDTVLSVATAKVILDNSGDYSGQYLAYAQSYPNTGYGGNFLNMIKKGHLQPYNSYGNGSAMRVSPAGWIYDDVEQTLIEAEKSAAVTHNHEEGIKGAKAVVTAIWHGRQGDSKTDIEIAVENIGYDLTKEVIDFKKGQFDVTCQGTIPRCLAVFLETDDFESAMRKTIAMGGDTDTNCAIVGAICDGFYGFPEKNIVEEVYARIPKQMSDIVTKFIQKYIDKDFIEPKVELKASTFEDALTSIF